MQRVTKKSETIFRDGFDENGKNFPEISKVEICKKWLSDNAQRKRVSKTECISSYALKHRIENEANEYIPNGACIQAAIDLGFEYWRGEDSINAQFYLILKSMSYDVFDKASGFSKWLFDRGDLYFRGDASNDPEWPRKATRFIDFWRYLNKFGADTQEELCRAWKDYSGENPPRPDLIDTRIIESVYDKQCDFISYGDGYLKAQYGTKYLYALVEIEEVEFGVCQESQIIGCVRVKYIGQTDDPFVRLTDHVLRPGNLEKVKWMGKVLNSGKLPMMAIFQTVLSTESHLLERAAMYAFEEWESRLDPETLEFSPLEDALLNIQK